MQSLRSFVAAPEMNSSISQSRLGAATHGVGTIRYTSALLISGNFKGKIIGGKHLEIGADAVVDADIEVDAVTIYGTVTGAITARKHIELCSGSVVRAAITTNTLRMVEGAAYDGTCMIGVGLNRAQRFDATENVSSSA